MKAFHSVFAACIAATALPVSAGPFTSTILDSATISVQGNGIQMTRLGSEYSASGVGVTGPTPSGGGAAPLFTGTADGNASSYTAASSDGTFQFSEQYRAADVVSTAGLGFGSGDVLAGTNIYGQATIQYAGTVGVDTNATMLLKTSTTGPNTVTATEVGPSITVDPLARGITAQVTRQISLTVFD